VSLVVDASVALKWVLDEAGSDAAEALLDQDLVAPSVWLVEAANALWRRARSGEITAEEARDRLGELQRAPVRTFAVEKDIAAAADLALVLNHPVHDCLYLALALREDTHVVTADRRFHAAAERSGSHRGAVRLLVD
jgi:predicted nucleic acid-binding protein